jgi:hypothetical protein
LLRILFEVLLPAAVPFVLYFVWLRFRGRPVATRGLAMALGAALLVAAATLVGLAHFGGAPPGSVYVPAHLDETGQLVPGRFEPKAGP